MSETKPETGTIGWTDLTVANAEELLDFYQAVVGWRPEPVDMGDHADFTMGRRQARRRHLPRPR